MHCVKSSLYSFLSHLSACNIPHFPLISYFDVFEEIVLSCERLESDSHTKIRRIINNIEPIESVIFFFIKCSYIFCFLLILPNYICERCTSVV